MTTTTTDTLQAALQSRMIQSGEYDMIVESLKTKLDQVGWQDSIRALAREKARYQDPPSLNKLVQELESTALDSVPASVKAEIEQMVQSFVEKNVEP
ncbi:SAGA histone acetylase and TREX-2 complexes component [Microbotryomycetes sp. JL221]|nr:SAGA histone acetylase and TREX-2 complexes component [Microbotryomycetes sp. JL221]